MKKKIKILLSIFCIPIVLITYLIRSLILVRWYNGQIFTRIGACVSMLEYFFANSNKAGRFLTIIIFPNNKFANNFLEKKYKNRITIMPYWFVSLLDFTNNYLSKFFTYGTLHKINKEEIKVRDDNGNLQKKKIFLSFNNQENNNGLSFLKKVECNSSKKIICLIIRDRDYLKKAEPNIDFSYHNYRNTDPNSYIEGIKYLVEQGYFVFRMGKFAKNKINFRHENFYDYAVSNNRSDFLDIWLLNKSSFCISTGTGLDEVARLFLKPILFINFTNCRLFTSHTCGITYPKILYKNDKPLMLKDYFNKNNNFGKSKDFLDQNIKMINYSNIEIKTIFREFDQMYKNNFLITEKNHQILQKRFINDFKNCLDKDHDLKKYHAFMHNKGYMGNYFLNKVYNNI